MKFPNLFAPKFVRYFISSFDFLKINCRIIATFLAFQIQSLKFMIQVILWQIFSHNFPFI